MAPPSRATPHLVKTLVRSPEVGGGSAAHPYVPRLLARHKAWPQSASPQVTSLDGASGDLPWTLRDVPAKAWPKTHDQLECLTGAFRVANCAKSPTTYSIKALNCTFDRRRLHVAADG